MSEFSYHGIIGGKWTTVRLDLGMQPGIYREGACEDICLARQIAPDFPVAVVILLRTNGEVVLWYTAVGESTASNSSYWAFHRLSDRRAETRPPTEGQRRTLERMWLGIQDMPGGLTGTVSNQVAEWAFQGTTPREIAERHGIPVPPRVT